MPWYLIDERFFCAFEVAADDHAAAATRQPVAGEAPPPVEMCDIFSDKPDLFTADTGSQPPI